MKTLIFDLDGTIFDTQRSIQSTFKLAIEKNIRNTQFTSNLKIGLTLDEMISSVRPIPTKKKVESIKSDFKSIYDDDLFKKCAFYDGVEEALHRFKFKQYNLNVVTNKRLFPTTAILKHFKIYNLFSDVKGYDEKTKINKKNNIKKLLFEQSISSSNTVYIGDTIEDFEACKQIDVPFIGVTWGYGTLNKDSTGLTLVSDIEELRNEISQSH